MDKPQLQPLAGYALIEPVSLDKTTPSGIVLPDTHDEKSQKGKVISLGKPRLNDAGQEIKPEFKVGDIVIYKKWGGDEIKLDIIGKEHVFIKFEDALAIVK